MDKYRDNSIEERRCLIQTTLDAHNTPAERNRLGQFATPNLLAVEIAGFLAKLLSNQRERIHFADPAIGSGSFFSAALSVFGPKRIASAVGVELDPAFANAATDL